jgi:hypothetical protein
MGSNTGIRVHNEIQSLIVPAQTEMKVKDQKEEKGSG